MYATIQAKVHTETREGTYFIVFAPKQSLTDAMKPISVGGILSGELRIDDGRSITADQRKKAHAMLHDIDAWTGDYEPEITKVRMKLRYIEATGEDYFSFRDCSVTTARHFINFLIDFSMLHGVPLRDTAINRTDDINAAIYSSLKHKRCIICGLDGEVHHWDAVGIGRDRSTVDDSKMRKLCLCRAHHDEAHQIGRKTFEEKHHVYGIVYNEGS